MESDKITVKTVERMENSSPVKTGIDSLPQTPIIDPKLIAVPDRQFAPDLTVRAPDAMGCYHNFPEVDTSRHIVPPPAGPLKLLWCQSIQGEETLLRNSNSNWSGVDCHTHSPTVTVKVSHWLTVSSTDWLSHWLSHWLTVVLNTLHALTVTLTHQLSRSLTDCHSL